MIQLLAGDCRDVLATLPAESVQCVVTSPPYYGLRDYGTALWDGGDAVCDHIAAVGASASSGLNGSLAHKDGRVFTPYRDTCGKCGARRIDSQIGLEATPDEYLATMVAVFREVRHVLRKDGTVWCNIGELDNANQGSGWTPTRGHNGHASPKVSSGLAPKQLLMMPARLALALQADGWWVRSDIIWHKPNPMPESCTDRPTSAHEHVYLLTRSARYYYDAEAVRETTGNEMSPDEYAAAVAGYPGRSNDMQDLGGGRGRKGFLSATPPSGRNLRNVWTLPTQSFSGSHFATFPTALAERCIRAGTSERGACSQCGKPWVRQLERTAMVIDRSERTHPMGRTRTSGTMLEPPTATTLGWSPACVCNADVVPCVVLDPFAGAGTTLLVADRLQRDAIGIELNPSYTEMAMQRCRDDAPLFTAFPPADDPEEARMADLFSDMAAD